MALLEERLIVRHNTAYRIQTERLVLRCWNPTDADLLNQAIAVSLSHLKPWMPWTAYEPSTHTEKVARLRKVRAEFDLDQDYTYGIFNREETKVLGSAGLHTRLGGNALEIGYWIHVDQIKQGLGTEVVATLTKIAFELYQLDRVEIHCSPKNIASASLPKKLGYTHEATLRNRTTNAKGDPEDSMIWTLFATNYPQTPCSQVNFTAFDAAGRKIDC